MKRILSIWIILLIINLPISCDDGCGPFTRQETYIDSLISRTGSYFDREFTSRISTDFRFAAIGVFIEDITYQPISANELGFSLINSAYACSPPEPGPAQTLVEIKIVCKRPVYFNETTYPEETNLSELFTIYNRYDKQAMSIDQLVSNHQNDPWTFSQPGDALYLQLISKPDSLIDHNLIVDLTFSDGATFTLTSPMTVAN